MSTSEKRAQKAAEQMQLRRERLAKAQELKDKGMTNMAIAQELGISESWVYQLLKNGMPALATVKTADQIAAEVEEQGRKLLSFAALLRGEKP